MLLHIKLNVVGIFSFKIKTGQVVYALEYVDLSCKTHIKHSCFLAKGIDNKTSCQTTLLFLRKKANSDK